MGDAWAESRSGATKADPAKHGKTPEQIEMLKNWLPAGWRSPRSLC